MTEVQPFSNSNIIEVLGSLLPMDIPDEIDNDTVKKKRKKKRGIKRR